MPPEERDGARRRALALSISERIPAAGAEEEAERASSCRLEQPASRDGQTSTFDATIESGSASESTAWASDFRSFGVSSPYSA
jgi:hypothetical protein